MWIISHSWCLPILRSVPSRRCHLSSLRLQHGYYTYSKAEGTRKPVSATSIYFESLPYTVSDRLAGWLAHQGGRSLFL